MKRGRRNNGEGSVWFDEARSRWVAQLPPDPATGKRKRVTASTQAEVLKRRDAEQRKLADFGALGDGRSTVEGYLRHWLEHLKVRESTKESYTLNVEKRLIPNLGRLKLKELKPVHVRRMVDAVSKSTSASTANQARRVLRKALNDAKEDGLFVGDNPVTRGSHLPEQRKEITVLEPEDILHLYAFLEAHGVPTALVAFSAMTSVRQGEALGLRWHDLRLDGDSPQALMQVQLQLAKGPADPTTGKRRQVFKLVDLKTAKSRRTLPLPPALVAALKSHRAAQAERQLLLGPKWQNEFGLVFVRDDGTPFTRTNLTRAFQRALVDAELPRVRWHDLRHGGLSLLIERGVSLKHASEVAGHSTVTLTGNTYSHVKRRSVGAAIAILDDLAPPPAKAAK